MPYIDNTGAMTNTPPAWLGQLPTMQTPAQAPAPSFWELPKLSDIPGAIAQGFLGATANIGRTVQAVGTGLNLPDAITQSGANVAANAQAAADKFAIPEDQTNPWSLRGITRQLAGALPTLAGAVATDGALGELGGASALARAGRGGAFMLPQAVGSNVQQDAQSTGQPLTQGGALKAIGLGLPEALGMGYLPGSIAHTLEQGAAGSLAQRALTSGAKLGAYQGVQSAANTAIDQEAYTPEMPFVDRAKQIVDSALSGGLQGLVFGGATAAFRPAIKSVVEAPADQVPTQALDQATLQLTDQRGPISVDASGTAYTPDRMPTPFDQANQQQAAAGLGAVSRGSDQLALPAPGTPPAAPVNELPSGRPMVVAPGGEIGQSQQEVDQGRQAAAGLAAQTPPSDQLALPPPDFRSNMPDDQLQWSLNQFQNVARERGLLPSEMGIFQQYQDEVARRTPPGATPGAGFMFSPEEVQARQPAVEAFTQKVTADLGKVAQKLPLFKNLNAVDEPDFINAIRDQRDTYDAADKTPPKAFQEIAQKYGVLDATGGDNDPQAKVESIRQQMGDIVQKFNSDPNAVPSKTKAKFQELNAQLKQAQQVAEWTAQADARKAAMQPLESRDAVQEQSTAPLDVREQPGNGGEVGGGDASGRAIAGAVEDTGGRGLARQAAPNQETPPVVSGPAGLGQPRTLPQGLTSNLDPRPQRAPVPVETSTARTAASFIDPVRALIADPETDDVTKQRAQAALDRATGADGRAPDGDAPMAFLKAREKAAAASWPQGPFTDAEDSVVGSPSVPPNHVQFVSDVMHSLGMGKIRVALVHPDDLGVTRGRQNGFAGDYAKANLTNGLIQDDPGHPGHVRTFGPDNKDFAMYIKPGMSPAETVATMSEEIGHIVQKVAFRNAEPADKAAINQAYQQFLKQTTGASAQDLLKLSRSKAQAEAAIAKLDPQQLANEHPNAAYYRSFSEWFASQVNKYLQVQPDSQSRIGKFFSAVGQKLKQLMAKITGQDYLPDDAVTAFMDRMGPAHEAMWQGEGETDPQFSLSSAGAPRTPQEAEDMTTHYIANATTGVQRAFKAMADGVVNFKANVRQGLLYAADGEGLKNYAGRMTPAALDHWQAVQDRAANMNAKHKTNLAALRGLQALPEDRQARIFQHLADSQQGREVGINPNMKWADHAELRGQPGEQALMQQHQRLVSSLDAIRRAGDKPALDAFLTTMQTSRYQELAAEMFRAAEMHQELTGVPINGIETNPDLAYSKMSAAHDDVTGQLANAYWGNTAKQMAASIAARINDVEGLASQFQKTDPKTYREMRGTVEGLKDISKLVGTGFKQVADRTYAPLSHGTGDYFVAGKFKLGDDGKVPQAAVNAMRAELEKNNFHHVGLFQDSDQSTIMTRVANEGQLNTMQGLFGRLRDAGHLEGDINAGYPERLNTLTNLSPGLLERMIKGFSQMTPEAYDGLGQDDVNSIKNIMSRGLASQWLDMLPDHALANSLRPRQLTHGYDPDMMSNALLRLRGSAQASSGVSMASRVAAATEGMKNQVQELKSVPGGGLRAVAAQDAAGEIMKREAQQSWRASNKMVDGLQAGMHSIVIGFNPAYVLTMMSQIPTLGHPELAKTHGYTKSAMHIAGSTTDAFKAMKAIVTGHDWASAGIRQEALQKAGLSESAIKTIMAQENRGNLSGSTFTRSVTDLGDHGSEGMEKFKNMANAMGSNAEMLPRLVMTLAAGRAYDVQPVRGISRDDFVEKVVNNSQFQWGPSTSSRMLSKTGLFGGTTPLMLSFMSFRTKMIRKLYEETHDLLGANGPQARKEAGVFLAAHMGAVAAIAGTLGLPGVGLATGLADKIINGLTGSDDVDSEAMYRTWLGKVFGNGVSDVMSKGLPRALGFDLSEHGGEGDLIPGSQIAQEKRKFEDSEKDWLKSMAGSAVGEIGNVILGGRDMMNGDYLLGATKMLPEGFKGAAEAAYAAKYGYQDKYGNKIGQPSGTDLAGMALGFDPTSFARYNEGKRVEQGLEAMKQYRSQNIETHLVRAQMQRDPATFQKWVKEAVAFQQDHPGRGGPLLDMGSALREHLQQGAMARAFGMPVGANPLDPGVRRALGFVQPQ